MCATNGLVDDFMAGQFADRIAAIFAFDLQADYLVIGRVRREIAIAYLVHPRGVNRRDGMSADAVFEIAAVEAEVADGISDIPAFAAAVGQYDALYFIGPIGRRDWAGSTSGEECEQGDALYGHSRSLVGVDCTTLKIKKWYPADSANKITVRIKRSIE